MNRPALEATGSTPLTADTFAEFRQSLAPAAFFARTPTWLAPTELPPIGGRHRTARLVAG